MLRQQVRWGEPGGRGHTGLELSLRRSADLGPPGGSGRGDCGDAPVLAGFYETAQSTAADDCDPCEGAGKPLSGGERGK